MRTPGPVLSILLLPLFAVAQGQQVDSAGSARSSVGVHRLAPQPSSQADSASARAFALQPTQALYPWMGLRTPASPFWTPVIPQDSNGLTIQLLSRLESRLERNRNERCVPGQGSLAISACRAAFQPLFDFDFHLISKGTVAGRVNVDVDYDSQREFDASNNISVTYNGRPGEVLQELSVGNISFIPPFSRYLATSIPSGNYGIQGSASIGPLQLQGMVARQKGRVARSELFTTGGRTLRSANAQLDDYNFEQRRFFFTIDPALLDGYPNIDILNGNEMLAHSAALPDTIRPRKLMLYRVLPGTQPSNPNGPRFIVRGARNESRGLVYEVMREGIDYYADPSLLWVALQRQLRRDERLVVAWNVLLADSTTVYSSTGGTPDLQYTLQAQFANLLWDPELQPTDSAFNREIRSAYRVAGGDLVRESLQGRVVTGPGAGQEKPVAGIARSYLELFGVAQAFNSGTLDVENRLWPRAGDPNFSRGAGGSGTPLVSDNFIIFPSLRPFARDGLASAGNPANDTIYVMPAEDLYSSRRPTSTYRIHLEYATEGESDFGVLALGNIQIRPGSERIVIDGLPLTREADYQVDYELGRVIFNRPDTLFAYSRRIAVQYEENPLFAPTPTSLAAISARLPVSSGSIGFLAVNQSQRSAFSRPVIGFEPASSLLAGLTGSFAWEVPWLSRALGGDAESVNLPGNAATLLRLDAEIATSRPDRNSTNSAWLESFQGGGGISAPISEPQWYFGSQPVASQSVADGLLELNRATTLTWQNFVLGRDGNVVSFRTAEIDPNAALTGRFSTPEQLLWLTLYPLMTGRMTGEGTGAEWNTGVSLSGRRWRSLRAPLSSSGTDLTRVEHVEFWALIDTSSATRSANPLLVIDLGDVSENSVTFSPDTALIDPANGSATEYRGKTFQGLNVMNSERDAFTRGFDAFTNDTGLPGDLADALVLVDAFTGATLGDSTNAPVCTYARGFLIPGDTRANCTVGNSRLDEEDVDNDGLLNFPRSSERLVRFVVNTGDPSQYERVGGCVAPSDPRAPPVPTANCWVKFRLPISSAEVVGNPLLRRMKTLRLTVISGSGISDNSFVYLPLTRITLATAPWDKRSEFSLSGIAGNGEADGWVSASLIGTQDSSSVLPYQPPPGVREEAEDRAGEFAPGQILINERSLRLRATDLQLNERAESYYRFPDGQKSFLGYTQLRLWARGGAFNHGWGSDGELNFFVRVGRDADNFYLYRTPINSGVLQSAWEPEIRVDLERFISLRAVVQNAFQRGVLPLTSCSAADSALVAASIVQPSGTSGVYFACDGAYMLLTTNPAISPPSLGAVQELSVGMVRISEGGGSNPIAPGDTLELWVDEIRLSGARNRPGYAGHVDMQLLGSGVGDVRMGISRRDRNFRIAGEQQSFATDDQLELASTVRLDRVFGAFVGWAAPLTVTHTTAISDPWFLSESDIAGSGVPGLRTPRAAATSYALALRRTAASDGSLAGNLLAALSLNAAYSDSDNRSEYSSGSGRSYSAGASLDFSNPLGGGVMSPSSLRLFSQLSRATERRLLFQDPGAVVLQDFGSQATDERHLWRSGAVVEFRPAADLRAEFQLSSVRDLRDYEDTTAASLAALAARSSAMGVDMGLESERSVRSVLAWTPALSDWLRFRFSAATRFSGSRDPNTLFLTASPSQSDAGKLPRRLSNARQFGAGFTVNWGTLVMDLTRDSVKAAAFARVLSPLDVNYSSNVLSSFSSADFAPSLLYQFSLGGTGSFRSQDGTTANSAGETRTIAVAQVFRPWRGATVTNRMTHSDNLSWTSHLFTDVSRVDATLRTLPDVTVRLERQQRPDSRWLRQMSAQLGARHTVRTTVLPSFLPGVAVDHARDVVKAYPMSGSLTWGMLGGFTTSAEYTVTNREERRGGVLIDGVTRVVGADIFRLFPAGTIAGWSEDLRMRLSYRGNRNRSSVFSSGADAPAAAAALSNGGRLLDNGRHTISFAADSDVSDTMVLSIGASQVATYDRNFNRRFTQTVFSALLQIDFRSVVGR